jgi:hypothetical protein
MLTIAKFLLPSFTRQFGLSNGRYLIRILWLIVITVAMFLICSLAEVGHTAPFAANTVVQTTGEPEGAWNVNTRFKSPERTSHLYKKSQSKSLPTEPTKRS